MKHAVCPFWFAYLPASQSMQLEAPLDGCAVPGEHRAQLVDALAGAAEPGAHERHAAWPVWFWKVPLRQLAHPPLNAKGRAVPTGQAAQLPDPWHGGVEHDAPAGQDTHWLEDDAPLTSP